MAYATDLLIATTEEPQELLVEFNEAGLKSLCFRPEQILVEQMREQAAGLLILEPCDSGFTRTDLKKVLPHWHSTFSLIWNDPELIRWQMKTDTKQFARLSGISTQLEATTEIEPPHSMESIDLVYIDGVFSHAIDQEGVLAPAPSDAVEAAQQLFPELPVVPLFSTLKFVRQKGEYLFVDLEMISPKLRLDLKPGSARLLSRLLQRVL